MMLKPMMDKIGVKPDDKITMLSLYETLIQNNKIAEKLFEAIDEAKFKKVDDIEIPLLGNLQKIESLKNEEKYIVDSIIEILESTKVGVIYLFKKPSYEIKDIQLKLLKYYSKNNLNTDLENEEKYIVDSVIEILESTKVGVIYLFKKPSYEIKDIQLKLLKYYSKNNLNIDLEKDNSYFDLSVAIMNELSNINNIKLRKRNKLI